MGDSQVITALDEKVREFLTYIGVPDGWTEVIVYIRSGEVLEVEETRYPLRSSSVDV